MVALRTADAPLRFDRITPRGRMPLHLFSPASQSASPSFAPSQERAVPFARRGAELIAFPTGDRGPDTRKSDPVRLLFVCRSHAVLSPMAEGLARVAYERLAISVQSAGLSVDAVDPRAITAMAEVGVDISQTPATAVRDLDLGSFDLVVSLGIHKLGMQQRQMAVAWDVPEFTRVIESMAWPRLRQVRDALSVRVRALGAILTATNRA
jgi:arsenate reductase